MHGNPNNGGLFLVIPHSIPVDHENLKDLQPVTYDGHRYCNNKKFVKMVTIALQIDKYGNGRNVETLTFEARQYKCLGHPHLVKLEQEEKASFEKELKDTKDMLQVMREEADFEQNEDPELFGFVDTLFKKFVDIETKKEQTKIQLEDAKKANNVAWVLINLRKTCYN